MATEAMEEVCKIQPAPCSRMIGSTCFDSSMAPVKLRSRTSRHWASSISAVSRSTIPAPTLLCRISMRPKASIVAAISSRQSSSSVISINMVSASKPSARTCLAVSSRDGADRLASISLAPARANVSAVARPLPMPSGSVWPAPAIIATLSCNGMVFTLGRSIESLHLGKAAGLGAPFRCRAALSGSPVFQPPFNAARRATGRILLALPAITTPAFPRAPLRASFNNHFPIPPFFPEGRHHGRILTALVYAPGQSEAIPPERRSYRA